MLKNIRLLGNVLIKSEQRNINGGNWLPDGYCEDFDTEVGFNPNCDTDSDGRECRYPFYVNQFGRCTL